MQNKDRIQRASKRLRLVLLGIFWALPLLNGLIWLFINQLPTIISREILPHFISLPLPLATRLMGFVVMMIPTGVAMLGVWHLMRLFRLYEQGDIFQLSNVRCFKNLSRVLMWWFVVGILHKSLLTLVLTLHNSPGRRMITFGFDSMDLTALLLGGILAVVAWVMEEGRMLQEDRDLTV